MPRLVVAPWLKGGGAGAVHQAFGEDIVHTVIIPVLLCHVGKGEGRKLALFLHKSGRDRYGFARHGKGVDSLLFFLQADSAAVSRCRQALQLEALCRGDSEGDLCLFCGCL